MKLFGLFLIVIFAIIVQASPTDSSEQPEPIDSDPDQDLGNISQDIADTSDTQQPPDPSLVFDLSESNPPDDASTDASQSSSFLDSANPQKHCDPRGNGVSGKVRRNSLCGPLRHTDHSVFRDDDEDHIEIEHLIKKKKADAARQGRTLQICPQPLTKPLCCTGDVYYLGSEVDGCHSCKILIIA